MGDSNTDHEIKKFVYYPSDFRPLEGSKLYLPVSMGNKIFESENTILNFLRAVSMISKEITIVMGDYLHRYNIMVSQNVSEDIAAEMSRAISTRYSEKIWKAVDTLGIRDTVSMITTKDFYSDERFKHKLHVYKKLYETDVFFHRLVDGTIHEYLDRISKRTTIHFQNPRQENLRYLLDELVIFEILAERGLNINIYPGNQPPLLKELARGHISNVPEALKQLKLIEIKFKPSKK